MASQTSKFIRDLTGLVRRSQDHHIEFLTASCYLVTSVSGSSYLVKREGVGFTCQCQWGSSRPEDSDPRSACSHVLAVWQHLGKITGRRVRFWLSKPRHVHARKQYIGDGVWLTWEGSWRRNVGDF